MNRLLLCCLAVVLGFSACKPEDDEVTTDTPPTPLPETTSLVWGGDSIVANPDSVFIRTSPTGNPWHAEVAVNADGVWRGIGLVGVESIAAGESKSVTEFPVAAYSYIGTDYYKVESGSIAVEAWTTTSVTMRLTAQVRINADSVAPVTARWLAHPRRDSLPSPAPAQHANWRLHTGAWVQDTVLTMVDLPFWVSLVRPPMTDSLDVPSLSVAWETRPITAPATMTTPFGANMFLLAQYSATPQQASTLTRGVMCFFPYGNPSQLHLVTLFPAENRLGRPTPFREAWLWGLGYY